MWETWKEMFQYLHGYYNNGIVLYIYIASFVTIMLLGGKHLRKLIGWPILVLMLVVFNPVFYRYVWQKCFHYGYWRIFWLFPIGLVISVATIILCEKIKQNKKQIIFLLAFLILIQCNGKNMFSKQLFYSNTRNAYKLPQEAIDVADALLELDAEPRVVMCKDLYSYIRQYDTNIKLMYGRDADGYVEWTSDDKHLLAVKIENADFTDCNSISELMKEYNYTYLVLPVQASLILDETNSQIFSLVKEVDGYNIFERI